MKVKKSKEEGKEDKKEVRTRLTGDVFLNLL